MNHHYFLEALKYQLKKKGHGAQSLVCRHTGLPRSYLSRIVNGKRCAGKKTQHKIAGFYGFSINDFNELGRRISIGEDPDSATDLFNNLGEDELINRLSEAIKKELTTSFLLNKTQYLYENIVESANLLIARFDDRFHISYANKAFQNLPGTSFQTLQGFHWKNLLRHEFHAQYERELAKLSDGSSFSMEVQTPYNNDWIYLTVTLLSARLSAGDRVQWLGVDITARKELIDQLHFIKHGVEMSYVPTLWVSENAEIVYVNQAVCKLLGYSKEELTKLHVWDINPMIPRDIWEEKWAWFQQEKDVTFPGEYKTKTGELLDVEFRLSNLVHPDGRRYNVVFVSNYQPQTA